MDGSMPDLFDAVDSPRLGGVGTYLAMKSFEGSLDGRSGAMCIAHSATTDGGPDRLHELMVIVPGSGNGELTGVIGTGAMRIDEDGTHHLDLDYSVAD